MAKPQTELQAGLQSVLSQLPSLLLNYRLQQDAQVKSLATKSAESILANSANYTSPDQFENSKDHINNMFNDHAGDPVMAAIKLTALETLNNSYTRFTNQEDASADISVLNKKASKFIGQFRTNEMASVINDMGTVLTEKKSYMHKSDFKQAKSQLDGYIDWYTVAQPVMGADTDPDTIGLQSADENILKASTLLKMNRTDEAVKWYMKSGVSTANTSKDQVKAAVGSSLRTNIKGMKDLRIDNAPAGYLDALVYNISMPATGDIDAASVPMYKRMFTDNVDNILAKSGWETKDGGFVIKDMNDGEAYATATTGGSAGIIEYLKDKGVWGNYAASVKELEHKLDFPGKGGDKENSYSARHFLFQLDALDKLDETELLIGNINKKSNASIQGTINNILGSSQQADEIATAKAKVATTTLAPGQFQPATFTNVVDEVNADPLVAMVNSINKKKQDQEALALQQQSTLMNANNPINAGNTDDYDMTMSNALVSLNANMRGAQGSSSVDQDMIEAQQSAMPLPGNLPGGDPGFTEPGKGWQSPDEAGIMSLAEGQKKQNLQEVIDLLKTGARPQATKRDEIRRTAPELSPSTELMPEGKGIPADLNTSLPKMDKGESNQEYVDSLNLDGDSEFAATIKEAYKETDLQGSADIKAELSKLYQERSTAYLHPSFNANSKGSKALSKKIAKLESEQAKSLDIQGMAPDEQIDAIIIEMFNNQGDYLPKGVKKFKSLNKFLEYLNNQS